MYKGVEVRLILVMSRPMSDCSRPSDAISTLVFISRVHVYITSFFHDQPKSIVHLDNLSMRYATLHDKVRFSMK
jgi:hypothetical protein